jgi:hypothetical protein
MESKRSQGEKHLSEEEAGDSRLHGGRLRNSGLLGALFQFLHSVGLKRTAESLAHESAEKLAKKRARCECDATTHRAESSSEIADNSSDSSSSHTAGLSIQRSKRLSFAIEELDARLLEESGIDARTYKWASETDAKWSVSPVLSLSAAGAALTGRRRSEKVSVRAPAQSIPDSGGPGAVSEAVAISKNESAQQERERRARADSGAVGSAESRFYASAFPRKKGSVLDNERPQPDVFSSSSLKLLPESVVLVESTSESSSSDGERVTRRAGSVQPPHRASAKRALASTATSSSSSSSSSSLEATEARKVPPRTAGVASSTSESTSESSSSSGCSRCSARMNMSDFGTSSEPNLPVPPGKISASRTAPGRIEERFQDSLPNTSDHQLIASHCDRNDNISVHSTGGSSCEPSRHYHEINGSLANGNTDGISPSLESREMKMQMNSYHAEDLASGKVQEQRTGNAASSGSQYFHGELHGRNPLGRHATQHIPEGEGKAPRNRGVRTNHAGSEIANGRASRDASSRKGNVAQSQNPAEGTERTSQRKVLIGTDSAPAAVTESCISDDVQCGPSNTSKPHNSSLMVGQNKTMKWDSLEEQYRFHAQDGGDLPVCANQIQNHQKRDTGKLLDKRTRREHGSPCSSWHSLTENCHTKAQKSNVCAGFRKPERLHSSKDADPRYKPRAAMEDGGNGIAFDGLRACSSNEQIGSAFSASQIDSHPGMLAQSTDMAPRVTKPVSAMGRKSQSSTQTILSDPRDDSAGSIIVEGSGDKSQCDVAGASSSKLNPHPQAAPKSDRAKRVPQANTPFRRIQEERFFSSDVTLIDPTPRDQHAQKTWAELSAYQGKAFRKMKTKRKRSGSFCGKISLEPRSMKFDAYT